MSYEKAVAVAKANPGSIMTRDESGGFVVKIKDGRLLYSESQQNKTVQAKQKVKNAKVIKTKSRQWNRHSYSRSRQTSAGTALAIASLDYAPKGPRPNELSSSIGRYKGRVGPTSVPKAKFENLEKTKIRQKKDKAIIHSPHKQFTTSNRRCDYCGNFIPMARLKALPDTHQCVKCSGITEL